MAMNCNTIYNTRMDTNGRIYAVVWVSADAVPNPFPTTGEGIDGLRDDIIIDEGSRLSVLGGSDYILGTDGAWYEQPNGGGGGGEGGGSGLPAGGKPGQTIINTAPGTGVWGDGTPGPAGKDGATPVLQMGTVTTEDPGAEAEATLVPLGGNKYALNLGIPRGADGTNGQPGAAGADGETPVLQIGTVTTGEPGTAAAATITPVGSNTYAINLTLPRGSQGPAGADGTNGQPGAAGAAGADGATPTLQMGTVTTGDPGTSADASLVPLGGDVYALNLTLPRGNTGDTGPAGEGVPDGGTEGQVLTQTASGVPQWADPSGGSGGGGSMSWHEYNLRNPNITKYTDGAIAPSLPDCQSFKMTFDGPSTTVDLTSAVLGVLTVDVSWDGYNFKLRVTALPLSVDPSIWYIMAATTTNDGEGDESLMPLVQVSGMLQPTRFNTTTITVMFAGCPADKITPSVRPSIANPVFQYLA